MDLQAAYPAIQDPVSQDSMAIHVSSEVGTLQKLLVHSPDSGLGKVVPSKAQDWLFEDIVHLDTIRRKEYDWYIKLLLYFLDPDKIKGRLHRVDAVSSNRNFYKPGHPDFHHSDRVIELQTLLADILENSDIKLKLIASVCAIEGCSYQIQQALRNYAAAELANIFITGSIEEDHFIFSPIPNFIFTRDIGVVINDHILLNKPAKKVRSREALLAKYIFFNHPIFRHCNDKIIEIPEGPLHFLLPNRESEEKKLTLEGGDVMTVSRDHVLIGCSERTSVYAIDAVMKILFEKQIVKKISVIKIPKKRDFMHIDTIFTQVKRDTWVLLGALSRNALEQDHVGPAEGILEGKSAEKLKIMQFHVDAPRLPHYFNNLEELLCDISENDLGSSTKTTFIYSGNNEFPFDSREQWTDSCNLLALKEGVVVGYDRNDKTTEAFRQNNFRIISVNELIEQFEQEVLLPATLQDTLILMPSAELSRARGGFHCMSMPLLRDELK